MAFSMTVLERLEVGRGSWLAKKEKIGKEGKGTRRTTKYIPLNREALDGIEQQLDFLVVRQTRRDIADASVEDVEVENLHGIGWEKMSARIRSRKQIYVNGSNSKSLIPRSIAVTVANQVQTKVQTEALR